ncbi:MAG: nuclear transport factor 2 family protein [Planctomycetota bacterium]
MKHALLASILGLVPATATHAEPATTRIDITFPSNGSKLVGHLYLPADRETKTPLPGVVVTGAWTTVKEQMPATYAAAMAQRGFAALTFDFRGWGGSEGTPRFLEHPTRKTEDILAAAAYLATRPEVHAGRIGGLGVCASSGYMADAARRSPHIRALALVAPWLHDAGIAEAVYGGADGVAKLIAAGREAASAEAPVIIEAASTTNAKALMYKAPYYTEADRGLIAAYDNKFNVASWEPWLTYDALRIADTLRKPTLAVHSRAAVIPQGIEEFARRMDGRARIVWLENVSQFDFYDRAAPVTAAADAVAGYFRETFRRQQDVAAVTSVVEGVALLADLGEFDALERLYAGTVRVDYSSLNGVAAADRKASELMREWAAVLPGFDRTRHALANIAVRVDGSRAIATADVVADHFVDKLFWQVRGGYRYELEKTDGRWRIRSHTLTLRGESGTRDVFALAMKRAAER